MRQTTLAEYQALDNVRFLLRRYVTNTEKAVRAVGLEPQQYLSLLQLRGLPPEQQPTIRALAERLQLRHNSVVELVNRMEKRGLFRREQAQGDRRCILLRVTPLGEKLLGRLVPHRIAELRVTCPELIRSLSAAVGAKAQPSRRQKTSRRRKTAR
jgi:DNA-binding MarR family transcriptional regulator